MTPNTKTLNTLLWILQVLLAALFLFAGVMKFILPPAQLTAGSPFSVDFIRFIGVAEILGALGLILPGLARRQTFLTPLAAAGLVIIMIGATVVTVKSGLGALFPALSGVLTASVGYCRWRVTPHPQGGRATDTGSAT